MHVSPQRNLDRSLRLKTGKQWHVTELKDERYRGNRANTLRATGDGKAVAWHEGTTIHVVDLAPPHEHRQYETSIKNPDDWFVGLTDDERFAVFQAHGERVPTADGGTEVLIQRTLGGNYPSVMVHRLVELKTGAVVDTRAWESNLITNSKSSEFLSRRQSAKPTDLSEPAAAVWNVSVNGKWEKIEDRDPRFTIGATLSLALDRQGHWRLLGDNEVAQSDEESLYPMLSRVSPSGEHVLLFDRVGKMFLVNTSSKEVRPFANSWWRIGASEFVDNGEAILCSDLRDDVRLIDTRTGALRAIDASGSQRRNRLVAVAGLLFFAAALFLSFAIRQRSFTWTVVDVLAASISAQLALACVLVSVFHPELGQIATGARITLFLAPMCGLLGAFMGTATIVGIYWAFGEPWLPWRWLQGGLALGVSAVPIAAVAAQVDDTSQFLINVAAMSAFGVIFATVTNLMGAVVRSLGWTLRNRPVEENPRQYGLATFFVIVAGIAVLVAVGKWLATDERFYFNAALGAAGIATGMMLAGIFFLNASGRLLLGALALFCLAVVGGVYLHGKYPMLPISRYEIYQIDGAGTIAAIASIAIPCWLVRSRGWRWRKAQATIGPALFLEAAA